jgi:hypothetical protein
MVNSFVIYVDRDDEKFINCLFKYIKLKVTIFGQEKEIVLQITKYAAYSKDSSKLAIFVSPVFFVEPDAVYIEA